MQTPKTPCLAPAQLLSCFVMPHPLPWPPPMPSETSRAASFRAAALRVTARRRRAVAQADEITTLLQTAAVAGEGMLSAPRDSSKRVQPPLYDQKKTAAAEATAARKPQEDSASNLLAAGRLLRSTAERGAKIELGMVPTQAEPPAVAPASSNIKLRTTDQSAYLNLPASSPPAAAELPLEVNGSGSSPRGESTAVLAADDTQRPAVMVRLPPVPVPQPPP